MRQWLGDLFSDPFMGLLFLTVVASTVGVGSCIYNACATDGAIDYCMIGFFNGRYHLTGHRPWRPDTQIAAFESFDKAVEAAKLMECKVK